MAFFPRQFRLLLAVSFLSFAWPLDCLLSQETIGRQENRLRTSEWPAYRRDGELSGFSPLRGGLARSPVAHWTADLGGRMVNAEQVRLVDLNADGQPELVRVQANRIVCQSIFGKRLWQTPPISRPAITQIRDFRGDGGRGLLVDADTGVEHQRYAVDGATGRMALLYTSRNVFGRYERFGKILPDVEGEQLCAWWSGDPVGRFGANGMRGFGYLWSFEKGVERPTLRFKCAEVGTIYAPLHLFADMDGDGRKDMVMISHEEVWVYDLQSGKKKLQAHWNPRIRTYWASIAALPLKKGERPSLLMINPMLPGVQVVSPHVKGFRRRWKVVVGNDENQYQKKVKIDRAAPDPFVDLDGDGELEILASVTNEKGDGLVHLVIFSAEDGKRLLDSPRQKVITVDNLDQKGPPEIVLREGDDTLRICNWNGKELVERWRARKVTPLVVPGPPEGHLGRSVGARRTGRNMPLYREKPDAPSFLLRFPDGVYSCHLEGFNLRQVRRVEHHVALGNAKVDRPARAVAAYKWNGESLSVFKKGRQRVTYRVPRQRSYAASPPLVGHFGGAMRIVVREFSGCMVRLDANGLGRKVLIKKSPASLNARLTDLDGDGKTELLAPSITAKGRVEFVAVDSNGKTRLRISPPAGAIEAKLGPSGRLGPGRGRWFVARYAFPTRNTEVVAYNGKTGKQIWSRDFLGPRRIPSTKFVLHLPTAVLDADGDGADDLIASSENWYEVISVRDNRTVKPNKVITAAVPGHWGAYATPIVVRSPGRRQPLVFHNNAYALNLLTRIDGAPVWHYGLTRDTTNASKAGLADLDGDGSIEIVTTQRDGLLRAFNSGPTNGKCPHCPAGQQLSHANHGGHVRWTRRLPPPISDFATLNLDNDGHVELLCGCGDGHLYALKEVAGKCRVLWKLALGAPVLSPVIADINADGRPEVLVALANGRLVCLRGAAQE